MSSSPPTRLAVARLVCALLLLGACVVPGRLDAQSSASASVTADVQQPITVTKASDLAFGAVFPGLAKTVAVTDAGAAAFAIQGQAGGNVNLSFTLPNAIANGGASLPITSWTARRSSTNSPGSGTDFVPSSVATSAAIGGAGYLYVFVGATAQPSASQAAGSYSGTATITVVYF